MLKLINTGFASVKGKSKFPKEYQLNTYQCSECGKTMKVDSDYVPNRCHCCNAPSGLKTNKKEKENV